jgi:amino acid transporter
VCDFVTDSNVKGRYCPSDELICSDYYEVCVMNKNVGSLDRGIRLIVGIVLLGLAFFSGMSIFAAGAGKVIAIIVGLVMIGTALMNFCPMYSLLGIRTKKA